MIDKVDLTLHFGNEDQDLREVLKEFPREEWEEVLKEALRYWAEKRVISDDQGDQGGRVEQGEAKDLAWSLEDLFYPPHQKVTSLEEPIMDKGSLPSGISSDPLKHLFSLIGEEDDEDVLKLLKGNTSKSSTIQGELEITTEVRYNPADIGEKELNLQNSHSSPPNRGLNYLLQSIIGEEDDPEVLKYFSPKNVDKK